MHGFRKFSPVGKLYTSGTLVDWTISHFSNFSQRVNYYIYSPIIGQAGKRWQLRIYPNGTTADCTEGWFGVRLINYTDPDNAVYKKPFSVRIGIIGENGEEIQSVAKRDGQWYRADEIIPLAEFNSRTKNVGLLGDYLVIFCDIRNRKASQTDAEFWSKILGKSIASYDETVEASSEKEKEYDERQSQDQTADENGDEAYTQTKAEAGGASESAKAEEDDIIDVGRQGIPLPKGIGKLLQDYKKLLLSGRDSDMTLKVQKKEFKAHRSILGARSPVFSAMLYHDMAERATGMVNIEDIDPDTFPDFLHYLYTGTVANLSSKNVLTLYTAADKYQVDELKEECLEYMKVNLSVDNFGDIMSLSLQHHERELTALATQFFIENATEIVLTANWQTFLKENLEEGNELFVKLLGAKKQ